MPRPRNSVDAAAFAVSVAGEEAALMVRWNYIVSGIAGSEPSAGQIAAYLEAQLAKTLADRDYQRERVRKARGLARRLAGWVILAIALVAIAIGLWQGWWPLWLIGGVFVLLQVNSTRHTHFQEDVEREAWARLREWEEALLAEHSRSGV